MSSRVDSYTIRRAGSNAKPIFEARHPSLLQPSNEGSSRSRLLSTNCACARTQASTALKDSSQQTTLDLLTKGKLHKKPAASFYTLTSYENW
jgi:hypothetical protein